MPKLPRITVITPSFNQAPFLEQTIHSVLSQKYPDLEYLVFDGGSTDGSLDILKRFTGRVDWASEPDAGQSHAINKGLRKASGDVIGFLNSDDMLAPGGLQKIGEFFLKHPDVNWVTGHCQIIDIEGKTIRPWITAYKNFWLSFHSKRVLQVLNYISQPATFWRREILDTIGYLDENLQYAMDYDYWLRISQRYRLSVIPETVAFYRHHGRSKSWIEPNAQFLVEDEIAQHRVASPILRWLHHLHNRAVRAVYSRLAVQGNGRR